MKLKAVKLLVTPVLAAALVLSGTNASAAAAAEPAPGAAAEARAVQAAEPVAASLQPGMSAAEVAAAVSPENAAAQRQYVGQANQVEATLAQPGSARAVPAVLAVFLPLLARCMWGALSAAAVNEIITLVHNGNTASAESRLYAVVGGCITGVIPSPLRWLANQAKSAIVKATLWIIVQLGPK